MKKLDELQGENDRLNKLANQDSLTGLLNRGAMEEKVGAALKKSAGGVFLMIDIDHFKDINEVYGHLTGDKVLQELARVMDFLFFKKDMIGRMGGDEFAIFLPGEYRKDLVESKAESLYFRALQAGKDMGIGSSLKLTIGASLVCERDVFQALYSRADMALRYGKKEGRKILTFYKEAMEADKPGPELREDILAAPQDMQYICLQLKEPEFVQEADCQDYYTFLSIYRFLERSLDRIGLTVQLILVSMTDSQGAFVKLEERELLMEKLKESIRTSLRFSDIYTRYSSCQFLAMTPGAVSGDMELITARICEKFRILVPERSDIRLFFSFYPLHQTLPQKREKAKQERKMAGSQGEDILIK